MPSKVLIFGGSGQIGQSLRKAFKDNPAYEVSALSSRNLCYNDYHTIFRVIRAHMPDFIINAVAFTDVDGAEKEENKHLCLELNTLFPHTLAMCADMFGVDLVHFSSDYVFDGKKGSPYTELDTPNPLNFYGFTKLAADNAVGKYSSSKIFRIQCVYSDTGNCFPKFLLQRLQDSFQVSVVEDQITVPTHSDWIAQQVIKLLPRPIYGLWNLVPDGQVSYFDFAKKIARKNASVSSSIIPVTSTQLLNNPTNRPLVSVLDNTKLKADFGVTFSTWEEVYDQNT